MKSLLLALGLLLLCTALFANTPPKVYKQNGIYYIKLDATRRYDAGYAEGVAMRHIIQQGIKQQTEFFDKLLGKKKAAKLKRRLTAHNAYVTTIYKHARGTYSEMEGIAKGAGISFKDILYWNLTTENLIPALKIAESNAHYHSHSTMIGISNRKFKRPNILAENFNYPPYLNGTQTVFKLHYPDNLTVMMYGFAGMVGGIGVNSKDLAVGVHPVLNTLEMPSTKGLPSMIISSILLRQDSITSAIQALHDYPRASRLNIMLVDRHSSTSIKSSIDSFHAGDSSQQHHLFIVHTDNLAASLDHLDGSFVASDIIRVLKRSPVTASGWNVFAPTLQSLVVEVKSPSYLYTSAGWKTGRKFNRYIV